MPNYEHALNIKQNNLQIRTAHIIDLLYINELMRASKQHFHSQLLFLKLL